ncbi:MAG: site-specific DNA-methyltransferase [Candidatus Paceibacterota bacterium]
MPKETPEKLDLRSMDITDEKKKQLKQLFPEVFREDEIDFDHLKRTLVEWVDPSKERFGLQWPGKAECMKTIQQPSIATLRPDREESVDFDETENLFIEGDNLEVLKLLQKSYFGKVKMIYIDPPYNTGNEFIYPDNYTESLDTYLKYTGQKDADGNWQSTNKDTEGRFHSKWLNMMYPRLFLAKNLLREDGVIFISIDDNELHNLRSLMNEIFGEENFRGTIIRSTGTRMGSGYKKISSEVDYVVVYAKTELFHFSALPMNEDDLKIYDKEDQNGKYLTRSLRRTGGENRREDRPSMFYPIEAPDGSKVYPIAPEGWESRWICSKSTYKDLVEKDLIEWNKVIKDDQENWQVYQKHYLGEALKYTSNNWNDVDGNKKATREVNKLFDGIKYFDHPKPIDFLKRLIDISSLNDQDIILDFFAGSASIAHAVLEMNGKTQNLKFFCIQLPELADEESEAKKAGFENIADIGKERIRRAIKQIEKSQDEDNQLELGEDGEQEKDKDLGFKVFKLTPSNFKVWEAPGVDIEPDKLKEQLDAFSDHLNPENEEESILFELILKSGFPLTANIEKEELAGKNVFDVENGKLMICLDKDLTFEVLDAIAEKEPHRVICLDNGFTGDDADALKTNAVQLFKSKEIEFRTV